MTRLILMTDFSETYAYRLLKGIMQYAKEHEPWVVCRMPTSYNEIYGIEGVLNWAKRWDADAIIAQFEPDDDVEIFRKSHIIAIAQDYKEKFTNIPNITSDYRKTGRIAAEFYVKKGFKNFAFYGYEKTIWSEERCEGFKAYIEEQGFGNNFYEYQKQSLTNLWSYESAPLTDWLKSLPKGTALFACDDTQGNRISEVCTSVGLKIPEDIAILGVDNDEILCNLSDPALSSVNLNVQKGGYETAEMIDLLIKKEIFEGHDIFIEPSYIVPRQSTDIFSTDDEHILEAIKYIHNNITKKITVEDIVQQLPLSRRLLEIRFKKATKLPVYKYIFNLRMDRFAHLLITKKDSIEKLANEAGISDYGNLSRQFKTHTGYTPSEYRKIYKRQ